MTTFSENDIVRDSAGKFDEKKHSAPETELCDAGIDCGDSDDDANVLFATEHDGVEYDVAKDDSDNFFARGSDGSVTYIYANADDEDHDSIDDALERALEDRKAERLSEAVAGLTHVGETGDIAGYTYRADNHKPEDIVELLIVEGRLAPGARGMDVDQALQQLAAVEDVDYEDSHSFDTDDFPKPILSVQLTTDDIEWLERPSPQTNADIYSPIVTLNPDDTGV